MYRLDGQNRIKLIIHLDYVRNPDFHFDQLLWMQINASILTDLQCSKQSPSQSKWNFQYHPKYSAGNRHVWNAGRNLNLDVFAWSRKNKYFSLIFSWERPDQDFLFLSLLLQKLKILFRSILNASFDSWIGIKNILV